MHLLLITDDVNFLEHHYIDSKVATVYILDHLKIVIYCTGSKLPRHNIIKHV